MPSNAVRAAAGAALAGLCAAVVAGCGDDVPSDAVARVNDTVITKGQFDHWLETAAASQAAAGGPSAVPDPPEFTECVRSLREAQSQAGGQSGDGQQQPDEQQLKKQCRESYQTLKDQVMQFLIQAQWVLQEAEERDISVSGREVRQLFDDQKSQAFPNERDYRQFLRQSGSTEEDILFRVKLDALQTELTEQIQQEQGKITREDIERYYEENQDRFSQPERRDLNVVLTEDRQQAQQAKRELDNGARFAAVAREYSIDQASKANGGKLQDVARGQQDQAFDEAVFSAERNQIEGPVETQFGWYVFEVTDVTAAEQQSLEDARQTIRSLLRSERQQTALQDFIEGFREDFKEQTKCREGFVVVECSNSPVEETETAPTPPQQPPQGGAPPQQGAPPAPQQAPPPPPGQ